jgi:hypothetical protein
MTTDTPATMTTLTLDSTVADALAVLAGADGHHVVVEAHGRPVGVVGIDELAARRDEPGGAARPLREVVEWQCVHVPPAADTQLTLATYRQAAWDYLLHRRRLPR